MANYTQADRPFRIQTVLGEDVLLLESFAGEEWISVPYSFTLNLLSVDDAISAQDLLRTPAALTVKLVGGKERTIHGHINRFVQLGQQDDLTFYRAELVPWIWFLSLSRDCKIFQNKSVLEIAEEVFKSQGYSDFEIKCTRSYPQREYCVQYRESHLNFVSRLLEEEGIFYYFDHSSDKHTLVLADDNGAIIPCPAQSTAKMATQPGKWQDEEVVTHLHWEQAVHTGKVTLRDYNYLQPGLELESAMSGEQGEEFYDYPGKYAEPEEGERYARLRLEAYEATEQHVRGESTCRAFQSGFRFDLKGHYRGDVNQAYLLLSVKHAASAGDYRSWESAPFDYQNEFVAIPHAVPYHPPRRTAKPVVRGSQTALVVGKAGEEIWVDNHCRVKVQFYWDRLGGKDENSSCWVRVASTWAGKSWGLVSIPRIDQEVVVDFLEGDPDRPIITGQVYNADQTPPFGGSGSATQSGMKSRSSKGGGAGNFNEVRMDDQAGSEVLHIRAEKDEQILVNNDRTKSVGHDEKNDVANDRTRSVGNNESVTVGNDESVTIGNNETLSVGNSRTKTVAADESISVGGNLNSVVGGSESASVGANQRVRVGGNRTNGVSGNEVTNVGKSRRCMVGLSEQSAVGLSRISAVGVSDVLTVGVDLRIISGVKATITVGRSSLVLNADGTIKLKGKKILIEGSDSVAIDASTIELTADAIAHN